MCKRWLRLTDDKPLFDAKLLYEVPYDFNTSMFDFQKCAIQVANEQYDYVGIRDNRFCYGIFDLPPVTVPDSPACRPCVPAAYSSNFCGGPNAMSIYTPSSIHYFAPPPPETPDFAPPGSRRR